MTDSRHDPVPMRETQHSFDVSLRGFDRHQVAEAIERLEADIRVALADRDAAMSRANDLVGQLSAMHAEVDQLRRKAAAAGPTTFENMSERISHMLRLAEEEAADIRRAAEEEAQALREQTAAEERAMAERHAAGQAEVERMLAEARQNAEQIASKAQIRADELVTKAQEKVARLDAESQARRAKVEEDFELAQRSRRAEAARLEEERDRASTQTAHQRVALAEQHAARLVAEAEAAASAIRSVRDELTGRLLEARRILGALPDLGDRPAAPPVLQGRQQTRPEDADEATRTPPPSPPVSSREPATGAGESAAARQPVRPPAPPTQPTGQRGAGAHRPSTGPQPAVRSQGPDTQVAMQTVSGNQVSTPPSAQTQFIRPVTGPQPAARAGSSAVSHPVDPPTLVQPAVSADAPAEAPAQAEESAPQDRSAPDDRAPTTGTEAAPSAAHR